jgi:nucleotide-binding universal stress UspA family protein
MTARPRKTGNPTRIVVAIDASPRGRTALQAAIQMAVDLSAEIQGLFIEDEDLVRLASLPFAREVDLTSATSHALQTVQMQQALRHAAEQAQLAFARELQKQNLRWTFRVIRGTVLHASLAAAADVDLVVIGQQGRSPRIITRDYLPKRLARTDEVLAVIDASRDSFRTIEVARQLVAASSARLIVLVLTEGDPELASTCSERLQQQGVQAELHVVDSPRWDAVLEFLQQRPPAMLVIRRGSGFTDDPQLTRLVNEYDFALVLC